MRIPTWADITATYGDGYQADSVAADREPAWNEHAEVFTEWFRSLADPTDATFLDVGCGAGPLVKAMRLQGWDAWGVEGSLAALGKSEERIIPWDLRVPLVVLRPFDLVTCFDVGEHVGNAEALAETCAMATDFRLLFGAATPDQDGHGHIDCRPYEDWHAMFAEHGLRVDRDATEIICKAIEARPNTNKTWWLKRNLHAYRR